MANDFEFKIRPHFLAFDDHGRWMGGLYRVVNALRKSPGGRAGFDERSFFYQRADE